MHLLIEQGFIEHISYFTLVFQHNYPANFFSVVQIEFHDVLFLFTVDVIFGVPKRPTQQKYV